MRSSRAERSWAGRSLATSSLSIVPEPRVEQRLQITFVALARWVVNGICRRWRRCIHRGRSTGEGSHRSDERHRSMRSAPGADECKAHQRHAESVLGLNDGNLMGSRQLFIHFATVRIVHQALATLLSKTVPREFVWNDNTLAHRQETPGSDR